ncbi:MAG: hypothetical protein ACJ746_22620 [Bryobacteraceae bacterium]
MPNSKSGGNAHEPGLARVRQNGNRLGGAGVASVHVTDRQLHRAGVSKSGDFWSRSDGRTSSAELWKRSAEPIQAKPGPEDRTTTLSSSSPEERANNVIPGRPRSLSVPSELCGRDTPSRYSER